MTKVIKIVSNDLITGVQYGLVEIDDKPLPSAPLTPAGNTIIRDKSRPATRAAKQIKQPGHRWEQKMTGAKKRIIDAARTKQK